MDYLKIYNTLDSTNKEAQRLLAAGPVPGGTVILARHQEEGKGQYGRKWISAPDQHLAMSLIYKPEQLEAIHLPIIGMKVSLGIIKALTQLDPVVKPLIKWPNDIYHGDKKLSGMLVENVLSGARVQHSIIGIGMNINESVFPAEIPNAISLRQITGKDFSIEQISHLLRESILNELESQDSTWKNEYDLCLFGWHEQHLFQQEDELFSAKIKGVNLRGHLLLETSDGTTKSFASHEVKWRIV